MIDPLADIKIIYTKTAEDTNYTISLSNNNKANWYIRDSFGQLIPNDNMEN